MELTDRLIPDGFPDPGFYQEEMSVQRRKKRLRGDMELSYGGQIISELFPFRKTMEYQLKRHGYNTNNMSFKDIIPLYYNEFISNRDNSESIYKSINNYEFRNNPSFKLKPSDSYNGDLESYTNRTHFAEINSVVDRIVKTFKTSQLKKHYAIASGQNSRYSLSYEEIVQANATDRIQSQLEGDLLMSKPVTTGELVNLLFWGFFIIVLYYILE